MRIRMQWFENACEMYHVRSVGTVLAIATDDGRAYVLDTLDRSEIYLQLVHLLLEQLLPTAVVFDARRFLAWLLEVLAPLDAADLGLGHEADPSPATHAMSTQSKAGET